MIENIQGAGAVDCNQVEGVADFFDTHHLRDVCTGVKNIHQITVADRIPGIAHGILGKADVDAGFVQFLDTRQAAAFGVVVKTSLQMDVFGRAGNKIDFGKKYFILAIIFGFLASASVEQVGMMAFGLTLLTLFAKMEGINKFFNKNKKLLVLLFVTLVGLLTVILAPSQLIRLNSNPEIDTLERIENNLYFITYEFTGTKAILPYVLLFNLAIFIYSLTEKEKNTSRKNKIGTYSQVRL